MPEKRSKTNEYVVCVGDYAFEPMTPSELKEKEDDIIAKIEELDESESESDESDESRSGSDLDSDSGSGSESDEESEDEDEFTVKVWIKNADGKRVSIFFTKFDQVIAKIDELIDVESGA